MVKEEQSHHGKWIIPALIGLLLLGALWSLLRGRPEEKTVTKPIAVEATPAVQAMVAVQPKLSLSNDSGVLTVSGTVKDEATKTSILNLLKSAFGPSNVKGGHHREFRCRLASLADKSQGRRRRLQDSRD